MPGGQEIRDAAILKYIQMYTKADDANQNNFISYFCGDIVMLNTVKWVVTYKVSYPSNASWLSLVLR